jgi:hypothetical protein
VFRVDVNRTKEAGRRPASLLLGLAFVLSGCGSQVPPGTTIPTGLTLDCQIFQSTSASGVNRIFDANINGKTCSAAGCHSVYTSSGGSFKIYPNAAQNSPEMQSNYQMAKAFANLTSPDDSKLILEPLAGSHGGGDIFPDTLDPNYVTIYAWIANQIQGPSSCYP